jgi:ribosomal protein L12E/L44/L45/RPP1/RPP2
MRMRMDTHGFFGWYHKGRFYVIYNHWDSCPAGLGRKVFERLVRLTPDDISRWRNLLDTIVVVSDTESGGRPPTPEEIKSLTSRGYANLGVASKSADDWYCLLHGCQGGDLDRAIEAGYILNHATFPSSSSCGSDEDDEGGAKLPGEGEGEEEEEEEEEEEYGYVCNLDDLTLDMYIGGIDTGPHRRWPLAGIDKNLDARRLWPRMYPASIAPDYPWSNSDDTEEVEDRQQKHVQDDGAEEAKHEVDAARGEDSGHGNSNRTSEQVDEH